MAHVIFYPQCRATIQAVLDGYGTPDKPIVAHAFPRSCSVARNGYNEADTWQLEFDAKDFPFDPDLVRAVGVEIYLFATESLAEGLDDAAVRLYRQRDRITVAGLADMDGLSYSSDGRSVTMAGRDYTALLIDREWHPRESGDRGRVPVGQPLDRLVQDIVDEGANAQVSGRVLTVEYEADFDPPLVASGPAALKGHKEGIPIKPGTSYWDIVYDLCLSRGLIAFVRGTNVVISNPRTLTAATAASAPRVAYGADLDELTIERQLAKERVPQIIASVYDRRAKKTVTVLYPEKANSPVTGVGTKRDERLRVTPPPGVKDEKTLREFCRALYESKARTESTIRFATKDLKSLNGVDLLELDAGTPVVIGFEAEHRESFRTMTTDERIERLVALGYSDGRGRPTQVARTLAQHYEKLTRFNRPFYVREVTFDWSVDEGIRIDVEALNYVFPKRDSADVPT